MSLNFKEGQRWLLVSRQGIRAALVPAPGATPDLPLLFVTGRFSAVAVGISSYLQIKSYP